MVKGEFEETKLGTPQGGNLSPLLSNIMLNELDKELEARGLHFVRYADDCVIAVGSSAAASRVMHSITGWIERKLGLKVNMTKTKVTKPSGLKYLGFGSVKMGEKWERLNGWHVSPWDLATTTRLWPKPQAFASSANKSSQSEDLSAAWIII